MTTTDHDTTNGPAEGPPHIEEFTGLRSGDPIRLRCTCPIGRDHASGPAR